MKNSQLVICRSDVCQKTSNKTNVSQRNSEWEHKNNQIDQQNSLGVSAGVSFSVFIEDEPKIKIKAL